jgi:hypothetical protein
MDDIQSMTPEELARMPTMPPPPGVIPNFVDPESRAPAAIATLSLFLALMIIVQSLKLYSAWHIVRKIGLNDWAALVAGVSSNFATQELSNDCLQISGTALTAIVITRESLKKFEVLVIPVLMYECQCFVKEFSVSTPGTCHSPSSKETTL